MGDSPWSRRPTGPLADIAAAISDAAEAATEGHDDVRIIFTVAGQEGQSLTGFHGYDSDDHRMQIIRLTADFIRQAERTLATAGIAMTVQYAEPGEDVPPWTPEPLLAESEPGAPRAVLKIGKSWPAQQTPKICAAIKSALEAEGAIDGTEIVILLRTSDAYSVVMSHGYDDPHAITHTLLNALIQFAADDDGCMMIIPMAQGHPN